MERDSNPNSKLKFPDSLDKLDSNVIISNESYNQIGVGDMSSFQDSRHSTQKVASNLYNEQIPLSAVKDQVLTINSSALDIGIGSLNSYNSNQKNKNTRNAAAITIQRFWRDKRRRLIYSPDFSKYKKVDITDYQISTHDSIFDNVISLDDETSDVYSVANVFARRFASIADLVIEPEIKNTENAKNIPEEIPEYIVSSVENEVDSLSTPVFTEYSVIKDFEKIQKSIDSVYLNDFEEDSIDSSVVYENNFGIEGVSFNQALKPIVEIKPINDIPVDTEYTNEFDEEEEISDFKIEENIKAENIGVNSIPVENYNRSRFKVDRDISEDSDSDSSDSSGKLFLLN